MDTVIPADGKKPNIFLYIFEVITSIALILNCTTMWSTLRGIRDHYDVVVFLVALAGLLGCILASGKLFNLKKFIIALAFTAVVMAFLLIYVYMTWTTSHEFFRIVIVVSFMIFYFFLCEDLAKPPRLLIRLSYVITVIAAIAIICWVLFSIIKVMPRTSVDRLFHIHKECL